MPQFLADKIAISGQPRITQDGYLIADVRAGRTGIQIYGGAEVGRPDMEKVRVYRSPDEVFKKDALASLTSIPVTLGHPPVLVNSRNWLDYARGFTSEEVARDGEFVRLPLAVKDQAAIDAVQSGTKELSFGYTCDLEFQSGRTPDGQEYDAIQKNIRGNHLAIVGAGRAGRECRIGDDGGAPDHGRHEMTPNLTTLTVDGFTLQVTDQGAQAIQKLQKQLADSTAALADATAKHTAAIAAKDTELGKKDAEIADLKKGQLTDEQIGQRVAELASVVASASKITDKLGDVQGKSVAQIKRAAVTARMGDAAVKDKPDAYVDGLFDMLVQQQQAGAGGAQPQTFQPDPVRDGLMGGGLGNQPDGRQKAFADNLAYLSNAWQGGEQKGAA